MAKEEKKESQIKKKEREGLEHQVLDLTRTSRMTAGGRRFRFRTVVVMGDRQGRVGVGVAKGKDVPQSIEKAQKQAEKNLISIHLRSFCEHFGK